MENRELYGGLVRLHVLHHAAEGPLYGLSMIEELARHGYRLSLHGLEKKDIFVQ
jgi:PadR family transcriptional regulator PadR